MNNHTQPILVRQFVKVDHGVPIPPLRMHECKWPWLKMTKVGDSFLCRLRGVDEDVMLLRMRAQACNAGKKHNKKFRALRAKGGIRVWRIE